MPCRSALSQAAHFRRLVTDRAEAPAARMRRTVLVAGFSIASLHLRATPRSDSVLPSALSLRPPCVPTESGPESTHSRLPRPPPESSQSRPPAAPGDQLALTAFGGDADADTDEDDAHPPARKRWAWLLAHVFRADLDMCPRCGGPMRWLGPALGPPAIARLLAEHGL